MARGLSRGLGPGATDECDVGKLLQWVAALGRGRNSGRNSAQRCKMGSERALRDETGPINGVVALQRPPLAYSMRCNSGQNECRNMDGSA